MSNFDFSSKIFFKNQNFHIDKKQILCLNNKRGDLEMKFDIDIEKDPIEIKVGYFITSSYCTNMMEKMLSFDKTTEIGYKNCQEFAKKVEIRLHYIPRILENLTFETFDFYENKKVLALKLDKSTISNIPKEDLPIVIEGIKGFSKSLSKDNRNDVAKKVFSAFGNLFEDACQRESLKSTTPINSTKNVSVTFEKNLAIEKIFFGKIL